MEKRKNILLINTVPVSIPAGSRPLNIPHGLLSIGTWILKKSRFSVKLIDCISDENYLEKINSELKKGETFLVGISAMSSGVPNALEITRLIKKRDSSICIVWGGVHSKLYPSQVAEHPLIDFVVYNEGEIPFLNVAKKISSGKSPYNVKGIAFKKNGKVRVNPQEKFVNLDEIGLLKYDLLNKKVFDSQNATICSSRGCPHRCTFCINIVTKDILWRKMSAENVIREIEYLVKTYNIKTLGFADDCFFVNRERSEKIADLLIEKNFGIKIIGATRADYFDKKLIDEKLLKKLKKAGFYNLNLSPEFGSQKMMDFIKKDITKEQVIRAIKMMRNSGIGGTYAFMTGLPTETKKDTIETVKFIKEMVRLNPGITVLKENGKVYGWREKVRIAGPQVYRPYPGGELYDYVAKNYNWTTPDTLEGWEKYFRENTRYKIEDYPWIEFSPEFYAALQFYIKSGKAPFKTFLHRMILPYPPKLKILSAIFYPFAKIRMSMNFFYFPFEYILGTKLGLLNQLET